MNNPARTYRENAVRAASPVGLIVILYEEVVRSLRRAQRGIQQGNIEQRTLGLTHAVRVIGHLQSVLNFDDGGDVARNLSAFYNGARTEILARATPPRTKPSARSPPASPPLPKPGSRWTAKSATRPPPATARP
jgi:flagellar biosynthetic protein FliS